MCSTSEFRLRDGLDEIIKACEILLLKEPDPRFEYLKKIAEESIKEAYKEE